MTGDNLLMELGLEQGPPRQTQVQPPMGVWTEYFHVNPYDLAGDDALDMKDLGDPATGVVEHRIVEHDHNWTIEIPGAGPPRPAILWIRRVGNEYHYQVLRPDSADFEHAAWVLETFENPLRRRGRRWLII